MSEFTELFCRDQHLIIDAVRAFIGLTGDTDPEAFFHSVTSGSFLAKTVLWMGQTVLGDGILVRRLPVSGRRDARCQFMSVSV